jgi:protein-tyrosine phosphatase
VAVRSAGTSAFPDQPASEGSLAVASNHGLDLSDHRSSILTGEEAAGADLVLGLTHGHVHAARAVAPEARVELLGDFAAGGEGKGRAVPDPVGMPLEVYEETYATLEELVTQAMDRLTETLKDR